MLEACKVLATPNEADVPKDTLGRIKLLTQRDAQYRALLDSCAARHAALARIAEEAFK